jgi:hypothetical protein
MSVYYFNSGTSWVVPAGVTGIQVECYGSSWGDYNSDNRGADGGSYSKSNLINVTGGSTVYMNIGSEGSNTWFNTTNVQPTSASPTSSACLAVGGVSTASASQIAANCGDVKYKGGSGFLHAIAVVGSARASGGQAGPNGNGADVVSFFSNTLYNSHIIYSGGGCNGGTSGSLGVPPYGRSGTGTVGSGGYWTGSTYITGTGTSGFMDPVGQYRYLNNVFQTNLTNYGPVGGSAGDPVDNGTESDPRYGYTIIPQNGFIVITLTYINGRKTVFLEGSGTWNLPEDWNDADNTIEVYGPGGNGATSANTSFSGGGGGGGAYVKALNVPLKAIDLLGTVVTAKTYDLTVGILNGAGLWQGFQGEFDSVFEYGTLIQGGGGTSGSGTTGGSGGFPRASINNVNYWVQSPFFGSFKGGNGGSGRASSTAAGGGGGGAAGFDGVGGNGGTNTTTLNTTGRGGGGGNGGGAGSGAGATAGTAGTGAGAGGTGGAPNTSGSAGGAGTSVYSGGGGGGAGDGTSGTRGGAGGGYGGGGGGSGSATSSSGGPGGPGLIIISYAPIVNNGNFFMFF